MAVLWSWIKRLIKRVYPLSIYRFHREMEETRDTLRGVEAQRLEAAEAARSETARSLERLQAGFSAMEESCARRAVEGWETVQNSVGSLSRQLSSLQEQMDEVAQSVEKVRGLEGTIHWRSDRLERCMIHCIPRAELSFEVALAEHCNLNCAGCDHFSPLAQPELADLGEMARDFARLSELFHGRAKEIHLLGGEPLLHPGVADFFRMARSCFPDAMIDVTTNGLLLLKQPDAFWESCRENRVAVCLTKYPIPLDFTEMERRAAAFGVQYRYFGSSDAVVKTSHLYRMDVEGRQDGNRNFLLCHRVNTCVYLQHGRLYTCTVAPTARHFNRYFGTGMEVLPEDSIDIYTAESAQAVMEFLAKPIPFCRYCMADKTRSNQPWHQSSRVIEEWT